MRVLHLDRHAVNLGKGVVVDVDVGAIGVVEENLNTFIDGIEGVVIDGGGAVDCTG